MFGSSAPYLGIFDRRSEFLNHAFCLFFLGIVALEVFGGNTIIPMTDREEIRLISFFFFNESHAILTLICLFYIPEMRAWREQFFGGALRSYVKIFGIFIAGAFFVATAKLGLVPKPATFFIYTAIAIASFYHGIRQIYGLLVMYNNKIEAALVTEAERLRFEKHKKFERLLYPVLIVDAVITPALNQFAKAPFQTIIPHSYSTVILSTSVGIVSACILAIILNAVLTPYGNRSYKSLFLLRLIYFPLWHFFNTALLTRLALHGIESALIYHKISTVSRMNTGSKRFFLMIAAYFLGTFGLLSYSLVKPSWILESPGDYAFVLNLLGSFYLGISMLHYYMESQVFKMRDPLARAHIGPLIR